ncbi:MAG: hypothetical protein AB1505_12680 [Candidatus Latescibacterota bacterium]
MPLTPFQAWLGRLLAQNRSEESYLAGGAAILAAPNTQRYSRDLDYSDDSEGRVASAFAADRGLLTATDCVVETEISQPGYIRAVVRQGTQATKVEWAQDSTWRFMPVMRSEQFGYPGGGRCRAPTRSSAAGRRPSLAASTSHAPGSGSSIPKMPTRATRCRTSAAPAACCRAWSRSDPATVSPRLTAARTGSSGRSA